ncbi:hypothetical protein L210DRAFT_3653723 [Boletus edulis BED1]|uniref:Uncharacterized protein n=1 Tax=Boletus edulis BED1 TaxID=1328754 RepID=A0AAD4G7J8_BOLED|nr:hypothetical protein L210DRAFT_3653723 [Boletus edulis BED1]
MIFCTFLPLLMHSLFLCLHSACQPPTIVLMDAFPAQLRPDMVALFCVALLCRRRRHSLCERQACRTHCGVMGGCALKAHSPAAKLDPALPLRADAGPQDVPSQVEDAGSSILGHDLISQSALLLAAHEAHEEAPVIPSAAGLSHPVVLSPSPSSLVPAHDFDSVPSAAGPSRSLLPSLSHSLLVLPSDLEACAETWSAPSVLPSACVEAPLIPSPAGPSHSIISPSLSHRALLSSLSPEAHASTLSVPSVLPSAREEPPSIPSAAGPSHLSLEVLVSEACTQTLSVGSMVAPAVPCEETPSIPLPLSLLCTDNADAGPSVLPMVISVQSNPHLPESSSVPAACSCTSLRMRRRDDDLIPLAHHQAAQRAENGVIVFAWMEDGACPIIHQFQDGFRFPHFIFSSSVVHKLGLSDMPLQRYHHLYDEWIGFNVLDSIQLEDWDARVLLVKVAHVRNCLHLDRHLKTRSPPAVHHRPGRVDQLPHAEPRRCPSVISLTDSSPFPEASHNHAVNSEAKGKQRACDPASPSATSEDSTSDSDSSTIVIPFKRPHTPPRRDDSKCKGKQRAPDPAPPSPTSKASDSNSSSAMVLPSKQPRKRALLSTAASVPKPIVASGVYIQSNGNSEDRPIEVDQVPHWPVDFFVCDIAEGFRRCLDAAKRHNNVSVTFRNFFGVPFMSSTFYDNRRIFYFEGNAQLRQECISSGRTDKGTWVSFLEHAKRPGRL